MCLKPLFNNNAHVFSKIYVAFHNEMVTNSPKCRKNANAIILYVEGSVQK